MYAPEAIKTLRKQGYEPLDERLGLTDGHPSFVLQTPSPRPSRDARL
jgi:hypothetical protein